MKFFAVVVMVASLVSASAFAADKKAAPKAAATPSYSDSGSSSKQYGVAPMLGYGFADSFKLGFGVKGGGAMISSNKDIYLGGRFMYYLGSSPVAGVSSNAWLLMPEAGYNLPMGNPKMTIRPYVGLGLASVGAAATVTGFGTVSASSTNFAFVPGAALNVDLGQNFCGADTNIILVSGATAFALNVHYGWYF